MKIGSLVLLIGMLVFPFGSVFAQDPPVQAPVQAQAANNELQSDAPAPNVEANATTVAANDGDKLICRSEKITGSNMKKRVCRTKADMEADREAARMAMERIRQRTAAPPQGK